MAVENQGERGGVSPTALSKIKVLCYNTLRPKKVFRLIRKGKNLAQIERRCSVSTEKFVKRLLQVGTGWSLYSAWAWIYDNPLWLAAIGWLGIGTGSAILTLGAIANNFVFLVLYQRNESDWLGVNGFERLKEDGDRWAQKAQSHANLLIRTLLWVPVTFFRLLVWAVRKNNILAFVVLSIHGDSFITTAFLRGRVGGMLTAKDYATFLASTATGCAYWSFRNGAILILLKGGWEIGKQLMH